MQQRFWGAAPKNSAIAAPADGQKTVGTVTEMDTGAEADNDSVAEEKSDNRSGKRKHRASLQSEDKQVKKKKDSGPSSSHKEGLQDPDYNNKNWKLVQSKKDEKKQVREQHPKQPLKQLLPKPEKPRLQPKQKKPRKSPPRPNALIIRPSQKDSYANILCRIKKDVSDDQVRSTVDKIRKTATGDLLIIV